MRSLPRRKSSQPTFSGFPVRRARDQARLFDPAASTDPEHRAQLERGADRSPTVGPLRSQGRRAQLGRDALGLGAVLGDLALGLVPVSRGRARPRLRARQGGSRHLGIGRGPRMPDIAGEAKSAGAHQSRKAAIDYAAMR